MKSTKDQCLEFLKAIGKDNDVFIRCLAPKDTPMSEQEKRGMTYKHKENGKVSKSTVKGVIKLNTGEFTPRYGDKSGKPVTDGWGHLEGLNKQGYGIYFVVWSGGEKNEDIRWGDTLFHESDTATLEQQQVEIDHITKEFGEPTAVVKTKKSLHSYWATSDLVRTETLVSYQKRWLQYSNCDDLSLSDPAQLMRLPGFDHVSWNKKTKDFDRVQCELLQLNDVSYSLDELDKILPPLDIDRWCKQSVEIIESDADDSDMRTLAQHLPGFNSSGKWIKAKCPAHDGESSDSLHINSETGGFICHAGCSSSSVYKATKAVAVAAGHRFEVKSVEQEPENADDFKQQIADSITLKNCKAPSLFVGVLGKLLTVAAENFNIPVEILNFCLLPILGSQIKSET
jgi:hypothetical protein